VGRLAGAGAVGGRLAGVVAAGGELVVGALVVGAATVVPVDGDVLPIVVRVTDREPVATSGWGATQAPMTMAAAVRTTMTPAAVVRG
jgi:hypothetical protein